VCKACKSKVQSRLIKSIGIRQAKLTIDGVMLDDDGDEVEVNKVIEER